MQDESYIADGIRYTFRNLNAEQVQLFTKAETLDSSIGGNLTLPLAMACRFKGAVAASAKTERDAPDAEPDGFPAFIADMGLEIDARPVAARPVIGKPDQWQKESFHFQVTIHRVPAGFKPDRAPEIVWSGFYTVGSGHALTWARDGFKTRAGKADSIARNAWRQMHKKPDYAGRGLTVADAAKLETVRERFHAVAPLDLADILESLQMDSSDWESTFDDWADSLGMDTDSRSAESIYRACQDTAKNLRAAFGAEAFERFLNLEG